jgi:hypothetical protein
VGWYLRRVDEANVRIGKGHQDDQHHSERHNVGCAALHGWIVRNKKRGEGKRKTKAEMTA